MNTILAHGSTLAVLPRIAQHGLHPRGATGRNNWKHTVGSNPKAVYLTSAYAFYFGYSACTDQESAAVIEIDQSKLRADLWQADEDSIEQVMRYRPQDEPEKMKGWDMKRRTMYYRARAHHYSWVDSLRALGTCAYRGSIPPEALGRVVVVSHQAQMELILSYGLDPTISVQAFHILGKRYEHAQRWLFGDEEDLIGIGGDPLRVGPAASVIGVNQYASLDAALRVHCQQEVA